MTERGTLAVVGTGVIGASWVALALAHGYAVRAHDLAEGAEVRLHDSVRESWPTLVALGAPADPPWAQLTWCDDLEAVVVGADFVQENGPERLDLKHALIASLDAITPASVVIASSSSGLRPTVIAAAATRHPERVLVGHPFHPVHLVPLVEVVGGVATSHTALDAAMTFYAAIGKHPVLVRQELDGHLANRLQAALWRESYDLVARGAATVSDVDAVITHGPGLRWAAIGPFAGHHLSGGAGGIAHNLEHLGPPMVAWWQDMHAPDWTAQLVDTVIAQMNDELGGVTSDQLSRARDRVILAVLAERAAEPADDLDPTT